MELSTIAGMFPGRLRCGVALGHPPWLRQMGLYPRSPLGAMEECVGALRELLAGREISRKGEYFFFDRVSLTYPPETAVPIFMGGVAPRMLELAGQIADGHVVPLIASPAYVKWANSKIILGYQSAMREPRGPLAAFVLFSVHENGNIARGRMRDLLAYYLFEALNVPALIEPNGIVSQLREIVDQGGIEAIRREMPNEWLEQLTVAGTPDECVAQIEEYFSAGADSVVLYPIPADQADEMIDTAVVKILPYLRGNRSRGVH